MKNNQFCFECAKDVDTKIIEKNETFNVKATTIKVQSKVRVCTECGVEISDMELDDATMSEVYEKYKLLNNMLTSKDIKELREKYSITQKGLALVLGFGEKTITRYENGSLQDKAHDDILKSIKEPTNFKRYWETNKNKLTNFEIDKVEAKLNLKNNEIFTMFIPYVRQTRMIESNQIKYYAEIKENQIPILNEELFLYC